MVLNPQKTNKRKEIGHYRGFKGVSNRDDRYTKDRIMKYVHYSVQAQTVDLQGCFILFASIVYFSDLIWFPKYTEFSYMYKSKAYLHQKFSCNGLKKSKVLCTLEFNAMQCNAMQ
ncbi:hypothetical protein F4703DRAFT_1791710 [Phycomyces blakesleeanus]